MDELWGSMLNEIRKPVQEFPGGLVVQESMLPFLGACKQCVAWSKK